MVVNPVGPVILYDFGVPQIVSARTEVGVTGGQIVYFSGAQNAVSSGANSYGINATNSFNIVGIASGTAFNGVVVTNGNTASGTNSAVAVQVGGVVISTSMGTVTAGEAVMTAGDSAILDCGSLGGTALRLGTKIGRAFTAAGSEGYSAWKITP